MRNRDVADRDAVSPFVRMLWRMGSAHEDAIVASLGADALDLRHALPSERMPLTTNAIDARVPLIVGGEIAHGDPLGRPDVLRLKADGYVVGDVKSGSALEAGAADEGRPKVSYGVQLAHYALILDALGPGPAERAFVVDDSGDEVIHHLSEPLGRSTLAAIHADALARARALVAGGVSPRPAQGTACKLCHWRTACRAELGSLDDLTLVPQPGRALRDAMPPHVATLSALAELDLDAMAAPRGRTVVCPVSAPVTVGVPRPRPAAGSLWRDGLPPARSASRLSRRPDPRSSLLGQGCSDQSKREEAVLADAVVGTHADQSRTRPGTSPGT